MSNRKEFKWANVQTNGTVKNFAGWDAGGNPVEIPPASSGDITTGTDDQKPVTPSAVAGYIAALLASETVKGIVEEATAAELIAGTATGATGAKLFITPAKFMAWWATQSPARANPAVSAGVLTLDLQSAYRKKFVVTTAQSANFSIVFANDALAEEWELYIPITGTVSVTVPAAVMAGYDQAVAGRWNTSTQIFTVVGATASWFKFTFCRIDASTIDMRVSPDYIY